MKLATLAAPLPLLLLLPLLRPCAAPAFEVTGKVIDGDTPEPVAGITVLAEHHENRNADEPDDFSERTSTDAEGCFRLELADGDEQYMVAVVDPDGHVYEGFAHVAGAKDLGTVTLVRDCRLSGAVRDRDGKPAAGVDVVARMRLRPYTCSHYISVATNRTDDAGNFAFEDLSPAEYRCMVRSAAHAPASAEVPVGDDFAYLEIELQPGGALAGIATGPDGKPLRGLTVLAGKQARATTDADGRYALAGLAEGETTVAVEGEEYVPKEGQELEVVVRPGATSEVNIALQKGLAIRGTVLEADGSPADGMMLFVIGPKGAERGGSRSRRIGLETDGGFRAAGLAPGSYDVTVLSAKSREQEVSVPDVAAGTEDLFISLGAWRELSGKVVKADGAPVENARLLAQKSGGGEVFFADRPGDEDGPVTDAEGRFKIRVREGAVYAITAVRKPLLPARVTVDLSSGKAAPGAPLAITLEEGCAVRGVVVKKADGSPVPGVGVSAASRAGRLRMSGRGAAGDDKVTTGADGGFALEGVPPGIADLVVLSADEDAVTLGSRQVLVRRGAAAEARIELEEPGAVTGRVLDAEGKPLRECHVMLFSPGAPAQPGSAQTDADGAFAIRNVLPGEYAAMAFAMTDEGDRPRQMTARVKVEAGRTADVVLGGKQQAGGMKIGGTFTLNGAPAGPGSITFMPPSGSERDMQGMLAAMMGGAHEAEIDGEGRFTVRNIPAGTYTFTARIGGGGDGERMPAMYGGEVAVSEGQAALEIAMRGAVVSGTLKDPDGKPMAGGTIILMPRDATGTKRSFMSRYAQTGSDGAFAFDSVPAGAYVCMVHHEDAAMLQRPVEVGVEPVALELSAAKGHALNVTVRADAGAAPEGASVLVLSRADESIAAFGMADGDGPITVQPPLAAGEYIALAGMRGYAVETRAFSVPETSGFEAALVPGGAVRVTLSGADVKGRVVRVKSEAGEEVLRCRRDEWGLAGTPWGVSYALLPTDAGGVATCEGLRPGVYMLTVDGSSAAASVTVEALQTAEARLALE